MIKIERARLFIIENALEAPDLLAGEVGVYYPYLEFEKSNS